MKCKPKYHLIFGNEQVGGFVVDLYYSEKDIKGCYARITTTSDVWSMTVTDNSYCQLLASAMRGDNEEIHNYCSLMYIISSGVYLDDVFAGEIIAASMGWMERLAVKGEVAAKAITEFEDLSNKALMDEAIRRASLSKKEARKGSDSFKKEVGEVLDGLDKDNG